MLKWLLWSKVWTFTQNSGVRILSWARRKYQKLWTFWSWRFWNAFQGPMTMPLSATSCLNWSKIYIKTRMSIISNQNFELWFLLFVQIDGLRDLKCVGGHFDEILFQLCETVTVKCDVTNVYLDLNLFLVIICLILEQSELSRLLVHMAHKGHLSIPPLHQHQKLVCTLQKFLKHPLHQLGIPTPAEKSRVWPFSELD